MSDNEKKKVNPMRRPRFERAAPRFGMTTGKIDLLAYIAECGMLTTSQVRRIANISAKMTYDRLRDLCDLGLTARIAVPYAALAPPEKSGPALAYAPGENIHVPTRDGLKYLLSIERISEKASQRRLPDYGPRNALFLAHELLVRDIRVWLELCARDCGGGVEQFVFGEAAHILPARPDGWLQYRLPDGKMAVLLCEADRGTERGNQWRQKAVGYSEILSGGEALFQATEGRRKARLIVVTKDAIRRDRIAYEVAGYPAAEWTYCCVRGDLEEGGLSRPIWRRPGSDGFHPLIPNQHLAKK